MENILYLIVAASLCGCKAMAPTQQPQVKRSVIVVEQPKGEPGDFVICKDGRLLVFPVSHPKTCS
jgi:hypothetical protein